MIANNIFKEIPSDLSVEIVETICDGKDVRIERIISNGQASSENFWYDQDEHEWVLVLQGYGVIEFEDHQQIDLFAGDYVLIPPHQRHRVALTDPDHETIWLAIFFREK